MDIEDRATNDVCDDMSSTAPDDDAILSKMGYKKDLHRGLGAFMNFAFGFTEVGVLVGICSLYGYGLVTGGPSGLIWGWVVAYVMTMIVAFSLAEICSAYPSAGSVYHWAGQLVPEEWTPVVSYACGWMNFLGNAAGDASFAYAWAQFFDAARVASGSESLSVDAIVGISILILLVWSLLCIVRVDGVGWLNNIAAVIHIGSILCVIIAILSIPERLQTGNFVFTEYYNDTGFTDKSYVGAISLLAALFSFSGYEASAHMAEETHSAAVNAPLGIIWTCFASGLGGLGLLLSLLFATSNIDRVLNDDDGTYYASSSTTTTDDNIRYFTSVSAFNVFIDAAGHKLGCGLCWLVVIVTFFAGMSSVAVTGRITFALARDNGFPFSKYVMWVHPTLKSPLVGILAVWFFDSCIQLLPLGSSVAFASITGIATIGFQVSYAIPISMKVLFGGKDFPKTPLNLGVFSLPFGIISSIWLYATSCLFFLPSSNPVQVDSMNWTIVVIAGFFFIGAVNWIFNARHFFKGPKRAHAVRSSKFVGVQPPEAVVALPPGNVAENN